MVKQKAIAGHQTESLRLFYLRHHRTEAFLGQVRLDYEPAIGSKLDAADETWLVVDKSIGKHPVDELYVTEAM